MYKRHSCDTTWYFNKINIGIFAKQQHTPPVIPRYTGYRLDTSELSNVIMYHTSLYIRPSITPPMLEARYAESMKSRRIVVYVETKNDMWSNFFAKIEDFCRFCSSIEKNADFPFTFFLDTDIWCIYVSVVYVTLMCSLLCLLYYMKWVLIIFIFVEVFVESVALKKHWINIYQYFYSICHVSICLEPQFVLA